MTKRKKIAPILLIAILVLFASSVHAAYLRNVPQTVVQPDGDTLYCYASGDEFFNYLHDEAGYTIIQDPITGFYVYAIQSGDDLAASEHIAGRVDPASVGLTPGILISREGWNRKREAGLTPMKVNPAAVSRSMKTADISPKNKGIINNIVILIRFKDDAEFSKPYEQMNNMFNDKRPDKPSMYSYFQAVSYNQLTVNSYIYPMSATPNTVLSYEDDHPSGFYRLKTESNPDGYTPGDAFYRSMALFKKAIDYVKNQVPNDLNLDYDSNGQVDNICFVLKGDPVPGSSIMWPHQSSMYSENVFINGKRVGNYNVNLENMLKVSVLCHEFMHTLSFPDLYVYQSRYIPVGGWDIMATSADVPQHAGAYTKWKYGNWVEEPTLIDGPGEYTLNALHSSKTNISYQIPTNDPDRVFVLEYRKRGTNSDGNFYESMIPGEGLLVYLIKKGANGNYFGSGEVYIFRPDGKPGIPGGNHHNAAFGIRDRNAFNPDTNPYPSLTNGALVDDLYISDIKLSGNQATFVYGKIPQHAPENFRITNVGQNTIDLEWELNGGREVLLIADTKPITDMPSNHSYTVGTTLPNGAQVIYIGTGTSFEHSSLLPNTLYYYKIFTKTGSMPRWSYGISKSVLTIGKIISAFPYLERFDESDGLPDGYFSQSLIGNKNWLIHTGTPNYCNSCEGNRGVNTAYSGKNNLVFCDDAQRTRPYKARLLLPTFDLSNVKSATLDFYYTNAAWSSGQDCLTIYYRTAPQESWQLLTEYKANITQWTHEAHLLPNLSGTYQIAFEGESKYGFGSTIDDIRVKVETNPTGVSQPAAGIASVYSDHDRVYIHNTDGIRTAIQITDLLGRTLYRGTATGSVVITPRVPSGFYIVHLLSEDAAASSHKVYLTNGE